MPDALYAARRPAGDVALAAEATLWLLIARLALRTLTFHQIVGLVARPLRRSDPPSTTGVARRFGWAVEVAARRAPWRCLCFERGLAAYFMLRFRGCDPTLYYGARSDASDGPRAHVWVRLGSLDVVGGDEAAGFATLATFPAPRHGRRTAGDAR